MIIHSCQLSATGDIAMFCVRSSWTILWLIVAALTPRKGLELVCHAGVVTLGCARQNAIQDFSGKLDRVLPKHSHGKIFRIQCGRPDGPSKCFVGALSFVRLQNPKLHILLECSVDRATNVITPRSLQDGRGWFLTTGMIMRSFLQDCSNHNDPSVSSLTLTELVVDFTRKGILVESEGDVADVLKIDTSAHAKPELSEKMQRWLDRVQAGAVALKMPPSLAASSRESWDGWDGDPLSDSDREELFVAEYSTKLLDDIIAKKVRWSPEVELVSAFTSRQLPNRKGCLSVKCLQPR